MADATTEMLKRMANMVALHEKPVFFNGGYEWGNELKISLNGKKPLP